MSIPPAHPDSLFDADWLALREAADAAARDPGLVAQLAGCLSTRADRSLRCVDLGCGSGANTRYLAPRLPGPQHWRLLDHDERLLARAVRGCAGLQDQTGYVVELQPECRDISALQAADLRGADLVCASALIDLASAEWLERLAEACAGAGVMALFTLSVDGEWRFQRAGNADVDPDDALARAAFNAHQRRDKGAGAALGPDAAARLAEAFSRRGSRVQRAPSPWRLVMAQPGDAALARALLEGWLSAAREQQPEAAERLRAWHGRRARLLDDPAFVVEVGHVDLLAWPRPATPPAPGGA